MKTPFLRKNQNTSTAIAAIVGLAFGLLCFYSARQMMSPWKVVSSDATVMFVSTTCSKSRSLAHELWEPENDECTRIIPVPLDVVSEDAQRACANALKVYSHARWFAFLVPDPIACEWLAADARAFHSAHYVGLPAFAVNGRPVSAQADAALRDQITDMARDGRCGE